MDSTEEFAELAAFTLAPLAGGRKLASLGQFSQLINPGGIRTPIMDVKWVGGVMAAKKVAALAETRFRPIACHDCSGPVTLALQNVREQKIARGFYFGWYTEFVDQLLPVSQGRISA